MVETYNSLANYLMGKWRKEIDDYEDRKCVILVSVWCILTVVMDVTRNPYYKVNKFLLSSIGQWPSQTKLKRRLISSFLYITLISILVPLVLGLVKYWGDVDTTIECLSPIIISSICIVLITNCIYNLEKMDLIFSKIKDNWTIWSTEPEVEILHTYTKNGETFNNIFIYLILGTVVIYIALAITPQVLDFVVPLNETRPKKLLFPTEYYLDENKYFYWMFLHASFLCFMCGIIIVTVDTVLMAFLFHACGMFAVLGFRLKTLLKQNTVSSIDKLKFQEDVNHEIKLCVKKHTNIIIFVNDIYELFSTSYFVVLGMNMLIMSVTGVQTVMKLNEFKEALRFGLYVLCQMFHLFYISIPCEQLINHSLSISDNIYDGYWYQFSSESQKLLLMIMRRCSKPCTFTAGKLYVYSMQNVASVLRTSMSYFTVLSSAR